MVHVLGQIPFQMSQYLIEIVIYVHHIFLNVKLVQQQIIVIVVSHFMQFNGTVVNPVLLY